MKEKKIKLKMKPPRIPKFKMNKISKGNPMDKFVKRRNKKMNKQSMFGL